MPEVSGLTAERAAELAAGWEAVAAKQAETDSEVASLRQALSEALVMLDEFRQMTVPQLNARVTNNNDLVNTLNDNSIPNLTAAVGEQAATLDTVVAVDLPAIQESLSNVSELVMEVPTEFEGTELPLDDDPDRLLVVGDRFYDTDNANKEYRWNGTMWVETGIDIADLSLTAEKFKTSTHMIY